MSRYFVGAMVDLEETYRWGLEECARLDEQMRQVGADQAGATVKEAIAALETDPAYQLQGKPALKEWMQTRADEAIAALADVHFDIPGPMRTVECMIAPTEQGGIYYTPPSDDFSRPGRMVVGPQGRDAFGAGGSSPPFTTKASRGITSSARRRCTGPSCSTSGGGSTCGSPATARAGPYMRSGS